MMTPDERGFNSDRLSELADEFDDMAETIREWADAALEWQGDYEDKVNTLEYELDECRSHFDFLVAALLSECDDETAQRIIEQAQRTRNVALNLADAANDAP